MDTQAAVKSLLAGQAPSQAGPERQSCQARLGVVGGLSLLGATLVVAATALPAVMLVYGLGLGPFTAVVAPGAWRRLRHWRVALSLCSFMVGGWLFLDGVSAPWLELYAIPPGLSMGLLMAFRALLVLFAISIVAATVSVAEVAAALERCYLKGFGFALGVALNALPRVNQTARQAWTALRLRGGLRRRKLHTLRLMAITIITNVFGAADSIVAAALARGFNIRKYAAPGIRVSRLDKWVLGAGIMATLLAAWLHR